MTLVPTLALLLAMLKSAPVSARMWASALATPSALTSVSQWGMTLVPTLALLLAMLKLAAALAHVSVIPSVLRWAHVSAMP
jgi:hypothetical protein